MHAYQYVPALPFDNHPSSSHVTGASSFSLRPLRLCVGCGPCRCAFRAKWLTLANSLHVRVVRRQGAVMGTHLLRFITAIALMLHGSIVIAAEPVKVAFIAPL